MEGRPACVPASVDRTTAPSHILLDLHGPTGRNSPHQPTIASKGPRDFKSFTSGPLVREVRGQQGFAPWFPRRII